MSCLAALVAVLSAFVRLRDARRALATRLGRLGALRALGLTLNRIAPTCPEPAVITRIEGDACAPVGAKITALHEAGPRFESAPFMLKGFECVPADDTDLAEMVESETALYSAGATIDPGSLPQVVTRQVGTGTTVLVYSAAEDTGPLTRVGFRDTAREVTCRPRAFCDGNARCVPNEQVLVAKGTLFLDAACTEEIVALIRSFS